MRFSDYLFGSLLVLPPVTEWLSNQEIFDERMGLKFEKFIHISLC